MEAYQFAGYSGQTPNLAWRLNASPAIRDRIAVLNRDVASSLGYHRTDAERDLMSILKARPSEAGPDHPLCEERLSAWGVYHRFPSKLGALMLLARLKGWLKSPLLNGIPPLPDPDAGFKALTAYVQTRSPTLVAPDVRRPHSAGHTPQSKQISLHCLNLTRRTVGTSSAPPPPTWLGCRRSLRITQIFGRSIAEPCAEDRACHATGIGHPVRHRSCVQGTRLCARSSTPLV